MFQEQAGRLHATCMWSVYTEAARYFSFHFLIISFHLFYIPFTISPLSSLLFLSTTSRLPPFTPLPFRKGQASHGSQCSIAYQVETVSSTSLHQDWARHPSMKVRFQKKKKVHAPGIGPDPTVISPTYRPRYKTATHIQRA